jgi:hypothetical protein
VHQVGSITGAWLNELAVYYETLVLSSSIIRPYSNPNKSTPHNLYLFKVHFNTIMIVVNTATLLCLLNAKEYDGLVI